MQATISTHLHDTNAGTGAIGLHKSPYSTSIDNVLHLIYTSFPYKQLHTRPVHRSVSILVEDKANIELIANDQYKHQETLWHVKTFVQELHARMQH